MSKKLSHFWRRMKYFITFVITKQKVTMFLRCFFSKKTEKVENMLLDMFFYLLSPKKAPTFASFS